MAATEQPAVHRQRELPTARSPRHDVFICYRRSDGATVAKWLRDYFGRYRFPAGFATTAAVVRPTRKRPLRAFLDTDEEGTSNDYWERHVRPILDASRKIIVVWTPDASQRRRGWDAMWTEIEHLVASGRQDDIILLAVGVDVFDASPGDLRERFPNKEWRTLTRRRCLPLGLDYAVSPNRDELSRAMAGVCEVPSGSMSSFLNLERRRARHRRRLRIAGGTAVAIPALLAFVLWVNAFQPRLYGHFRALDRAVDRIVESHSPAGDEELLGSLDSTFYAEVWLQPFQRGLVLHVTQLEQAFESTRLPDHGRTVFLLQADELSKYVGRWLFQRRPPIAEPPRDLEEFKGWMSIPKRDELMRDRGFAEEGGLTDAEIAASYSIHGGGGTISGGIATAYTIFRLDRFFGRLVSDERSVPAVFRVHEHGYALLVAGTAPDGTSDPSVNTLFTFHRDWELNEPETRTTAGRAYHSGRWFAATAPATAIERALRPTMPTRLAIRAR